MATQPMLPEYASQPPFATKEERMVTAALQSAVAPGPRVRSMLTRPLFLSGVHKMEALTVEDCLNLSRETMYNTNYTGGAWDISGASRNTGYGWL